MSCLASSDICPPKGHMLFYLWIANVCCHSSSVMQSIVTCTPHTYTHSPTPPHITHIHTLTHPSSHTHTCTHTHTRRCWYQRSPHSNKCRWPEAHHGHHNHLGCGLPPHSTWPARAQTWSDWIDNWFDGSSYHLWCSQTLPDWYHDCTSC